MRPAVISAWRIRCSATGRSRSSSPGRSPVGQAGAGEILVSRTVRDLVVGPGTGFDDRGSVELRGVPGTWQLLAVHRHGPPVGSAEAQLASTPTPGPRTTMRRADRAAQAIARRAPWIVRGIASLTPATRRAWNSSGTNGGAAGVDLMNNLR
jgi:hypothetical protein